MAASIIPSMSEYRDPPPTLASAVAELEACAHDRYPGTIDTLQCISTVDNIRGFIALALENYHQPLGMGLRPSTETSCSSFSPCRVDEYNDPVTPSPTWLIRKVSNIA